MAENDRGAGLLIAPHYDPAINIPMAPVTQLASPDKEIRVKAQFSL
jgi:hypothetical protein